MKTKPHAEMVANILRTYNAATDDDKLSGDTWYEAAHTWCAYRARYHGVLPEQVAGIVAALSPLTPWKRNLELATMTLQRVERIPTLTANATKAQRILAGESPWSVLTSQKVRAFFEGILYNGETDTVCVDRHAMSVAYGCAVPKAEQGMTPKQYSNYVAAYVDAAAQVGIPAAKLQAITWVAWRRTRGIVD